MSKKSKTENVNDEKTIVKQVMVLEHKFSEEELKEFSELIATEIQAKAEIESEKKAIVSGYKARIEEKETSISKLAKNITTKEEERPIDCEIHMNTPIIGEKTAYRMDTNEVVWTKKMEWEEMQLKLEIPIGEESMAAHSQLEDNHA